jgi:regulatory protein YycH of two-component signal transduction system YycFG
MNGTMYEAAKTVVLTFLVLVSIVLTFGLWTYHPKYDVLQNDEYIQHVSVSNTQVDTALIVQPSQLLFHKNNAHYGIVEEEETSEILKEIKKWVIDDFENISNTIPKGKFLSFLREKERLELVYPDSIPIDVYRSIFQIEDKGIKHISFDRIIIPLGNKDELPIYFISTEKRKVYKAVATDVSLSEINKLTTELDKYPRYFPYVINETKQIFLPEKEVTMNRLQYYTDELDSDKFKEALFSDPSFVKKDLITFGEEYTDGSRLMDVDFLQRMLLYVNPAARTLNDNENQKNDDLIQKSIDFVNEHGGWTDMYRFARWNEDERKVVFRLMVNNHPVFNEYGMSEIVQIWGSSDLVKYQRPLFRLEVADRVNVPMTLLSGREVVKKIETMKGFKKELVKDIAVGYELIKDPEREKVIILEPSWFYLYGQTWKKISLDDQDSEKRGGNVNGLE